MSDLFIFCCPSCKSFGNNNGQCLKCGYDKDCVATYKDEKKELERQLGVYRELTVFSQNWVKMSEPKQRASGGVSMFYLCPKCKEQSKYSYWDGYKSSMYDNGKCGGYLAKCLKCGYDESSNKQLQTSAKQRQKKDEDKIREMVKAVISPPKTPIVYFSGSAWKSDTGTSCPIKPWAFASSDLNKMFFSGKLWNCPRVMIADTTAHECGHLAPERGKTLEDAKNEGYHIPTEDAYKEADEIEKTAIQSGYSLALAKLSELGGLKGNTYEHKILPYHLYEKIKNGWPDNKIPNSPYSSWEKPEWGGLGEFWGAGDGHGHGWYGSYQNYKSIIFGQFSTWINDPSQPPARMYQAPTYTQEWFAIGGRYKDYDQVIKGKPYHADIDKFGDKFFKADEDWNNYVKNLPDASN